MRGLARALPIAQDAVAVGLRGLTVAVRVGLLALTVAALPVAAQAHEHGPGSGFLVAHDAAPVGTAYVGNLAHFDVLDLGSDLVPDFHQQNHIRVVENGVVLFETTPDSGHDYDGVNSFDIAFPVPGSYVVESLDDKGLVAASFNGTVDPADGPALVLANITLDGPDAAMTGAPATYKYSIVGADGALVPHSDAMFEVWQGTDLLFRTHTHSHETGQEVAYVFQLPGTYTVRIVGFLAYPTSGDPIFAPVVAEEDVTVSPGPPQLGLGGDAPVPPVVPLDNAVATGTTAGGNYTLVGTYDPYTSVGTYSQMRLSALVMDPVAMAPVQHVNFVAELRGPSVLGLAGETPPLFASKTLHEYDGVLEFASRQQVPGHYTLVVDAAKNGWSGHLEMPFDVIPPGPGTGAGPQVYKLTGAEKLSAGVPANLQLSATDLAMVPFMHSETVAEILDSHGLPVFFGKLHTHENGLFAWTMTLPMAGNYTLRLSPFPLDGSLTPTYQDSMGAATEFRLQVGAGPGIPIPATPEPMAQAQPVVHSPAVSVLVVGLLVVLGLRARKLGT